MNDINTIELIKLENKMRQEGMSTKQIMKFLKRIGLYQDKTIRIYRKAFKLLFLRNPNRK